MKTLKTKERMLQQVRDWKARKRAEDPEAYIKRQRAYSKTFRDKEENKDKLRKQVLEWYHADPERMKRKNEYNKEYRKKNRDIINFHTVKRRSDKLSRMPKWLTKEDRAEIRHLYKLATFLKKTTGQAWHVDHIIPLRGKKVSGLHVPTNLQIMLAEDNIKKHNTYKVE